MLVNKLYKDNKGIMTILMLFMIIGLFLGLMLILVGGIVTIKIHDALDQDLDMGQVNLQNMTADTFGKFNTMYLNNADWWGIALIFGMIIGLFLSSYITRNSVPKWAIVFDIFIIITVFIFSLYISSAYSSVLDAFNSAGETFLETYTPKSSMFMLNLPIFVVIIGVIMMVLFHSSIPRRPEERMQEGGVLRGI